MRLNSLVKVKKKGHMTIYSLIYGMILKMDFPYLSHLNKSIKIYFNHEK